MTPETEDRIRTALIANAWMFDGDRLDERVESIRRAEEELKVKKPGVAFREDVVFLDKRAHFILEALPPHEGRWTMTF
jgi:hypothetical protein